MALGLTIRWHIRQHKRADLLSLAFILVLPFISHLCDSKESAAAKAQGKASLVMVLNSAWTERPRG